MTKLEALAKDCIENHTHKLVDKPTKQDIYLREESIFIQGYRQSEKRIAELEATNKKISDECHKLVDSLEKEQKENAELKGLKDVATLIRANNDTVITLMQLNNKLVSKSQQLTKAKEIIKNIIRVTWGEGWNYSLDWKVKAEQFLSEVEK